MGKSATSTPKPLQQGDPPVQDGAGTPPQAGTQEPPVSQPGSESFTSVDITTINRDDLTPAMQPVYDSMLEMHSRMNTDYTQKTQAMASDREDAELWQSVQQHPVIRQRLGEMLLQVSSGQTLSPDAPPAPDVQVEPGPPAEEPGSPQAIIRAVVREELRGILPDLKGGFAEVKEVVGFMQNNQAQLEFNALAAKYPAAVAIGINRLNMFRSQYSGPGGNPVSMEQALGLMALSNPAIVQPAAAAATAAAPKTPLVEQPKGAVSATATTSQVQGGAKGLQARLKDMAEKKIPLGLDAAAERVLAKLGVVR